MDQREGIVCGSEGRNGVWIRGKEWCVEYVAGLYLRNFEGGGSNTTWSSGHSKGVVKERECVPSPVQSTELCEVHGRLKSEIHHKNPSVTKHT